jgi:hypothetical protein
MQTNIALKFPSAFSFHFITKQIKKESEYCGTSNIRLLGHLYLLLKGILAAVSPTPYDSVKKPEITFYLTMHNVMVIEINIVFSRARLRLSIFSI